jgi:hypothetical protein
MIMFVVTVNVDVIERARSLTSLQAADNQVSATRNLTVHIHVWISSNPRKETDYQSSISGSAGYFFSFSPSRLTLTILPTV